MAASALLRVIPPNHRQPDACRAFGAGRGKRCAAVLVIFDILRGVVGAFKAVGHHALAAAVGQLFHQRVAGVGKQRAAFGQQRRIFFERAIDRVDILVIVEVVVVDVVDERVGGPQLQKALHIFAGFGEKRGVLPHGHAAAQKIDHAADMNGEVDVAFPKDQRTHRCDRGFAVAACDAHHCVELPADLPQQHRAFHHRNAQTLRRVIFQVARFDGGRIDHQCRAVEVLGVVSDREWDAFAFQLFGECRFGDIGPLRHNTPGSSK